MGGGGGAEKKEGKDGRNPREKFKPEAQGFALRGPPLLRVYLAPVSERLLG